MPHWARLAVDICPCPDRSPARICPSSSDLPVSASTALEKLVYRVKVAADLVGEPDRADGRAELRPALAALPAGGTEGANRGQLR